MLDIHRRCRQQFFSRRSITHNQRVEFAIRAVVNDGWLSISINEAKKHKVVAPGPTKFQGPCPQPIPASSVPNSNLQLLVFLLIWADNIQHSVTVHIDKLQVIKIVGCVHPWCSPQKVFGPQNLAIGWVNHRHLKIVRRLGETTCRNSAITDDQQSFVIDQLCKLDTTVDRIRHRPLRPPGLCIQQNQRQIRCPKQNT